MFQIDEVLAKEGGDVLFTTIDAGRGGHYTKGLLKEEDVWVNLMLYANKEKQTAVETAIDIATMDWETAGRIVDYIAVPRAVFSNINFGVDVSTQLQTLKLLCS